MNFIFLTIWMGRYWVQRHRYTRRELGSDTDCNEKKKNQLIYEEQSEKSEKSVKSEKLEKSVKSANFLEKSEKIGY